MQKIKIYVMLHLMLMIYSMGGICSKKASGYPFFSAGFCICYAGVILVLLFYAVGWQQVIRHLPLTAAFVNKAVTILWGIVWGACFFKEPVTAGKAAGAVLVMAGILLYAGAGKGE